MIEDGTCKIVGIAGTSAACPIHCRLSAADSCNKCQNCVTIGRVPAFGASIVERRRWTSGIEVGSCNEPHNNNNNTNNNNNAINVYDNINETIKRKRKNAKFGFLQKLYSFTSMYAVKYDFLVVILVK